MGNSLGSSNSDDSNFRTRTRNSRNSIAPNSDSVSRVSFSSRDSALAEAGTIVPRRQRRRLSTRRNDAVLLSLSRLIVETGRRADWVDVNDSWDEKKVETLVEAMLLAPRQQGMDEPFGEYQEECPICFYFYSRVNRSSCCNKPICTNCFVHIQRKIRKKCPYCNKWGLEVCLPKHSCSNDGEQQETQSWSNDKENVEHKGLSTLVSTRNRCKREDSIDSSKKFGYSDSSLAGKRSAVRSLLKEECRFSSERNDEENLKERDRRTVHEELDSRECSLIDTSDSIVSDINPVSAGEQLYYRSSETVGGCEETESSEQRLENSVCEVEEMGSSRTLSSVDYANRMMDESLLDSLAIATSSSTVPPKVYCAEQLPTNEHTRESPSVVFTRRDELAENSLFDIEEDNDMFIQLFQFEHSTSSPAQVDNLIHLCSGDRDEET